MINSPQNAKTLKNINLTGQIQTPNSHLEKVQYKDSLSPKLNFKGPKRNHQGAGPSISMAPKNIQNILDDQESQTDFQTVLTPFDNQKISEEMAKPPQTTTLRLDPAMIHDIMKGSAGIPVNFKK